MIVEVVAPDSNALRVSHSAMVFYASCLTPSAVEAVVVVVEKASSTVW